MKSDTKLTMNADVSIASMRDQELRAFAFFLGQAGFTASLARKMMEEGASSQKARLIVAVANGEVKAKDLSSVGNHKLVENTRVSTKFAVTDYDHTFIVPADYRHDQSIATLAQGLNGKRAHWSENLLDESFPLTTVSLAPARSVRVRTIIAKENVSYKEAIDFLLKRRALLMGAQGLSLLAPLFMDKLPLGTSVVSLDEETKLFMDDGGCFRFPRMFVESDRRASFYLNYTRHPIDQGTHIIWACYET